MHRLPQLLRDGDRPVAIGVGEEEDELLAAASACEVTVPKLRSKQGRGRCQRVIPAVVAEGVIDLLEVIQVQQNDRQGTDRSVCLSNEASQHVVDAAPVRQAREDVCRSPVLGDRQVAEIGEDRRRLSHSVLEAPVRCSVEPLIVADEYGSDHFSADEQRLAARRARQAPTDSAGEDLFRFLRAAVVPPAQPNGEA